MFFFTKFCMYFSGLISPDWAVSQAHSCSGRKLWKPLRGETVFRFSAESVLWHSSRPLCLACKPALFRMSQCKYAMYMFSLLEGKLSKYEIWPASLQTQELGTGVLGRRKVTSSFLKSFFTVRSDLLSCVYMCIFNFHTEYRNWMKKIKENVGLGGCRMWHKYRRQVKYRMPTQ